MPSFVHRPLAAAFLLAALPVVPARAQDTSRVRADTARADTSARRDSLKIPLDTAGMTVRVTVPPPAPTPWHFQVDLGFQDIGGNRELTVVNTGFAVEHRSQDNYILSTKLEIRYGNSNGEEAVNYQGLGLRFDLHPRAQVSPFVGADLVRDRVRLIGLREQGGLGINYNTDIRDDRRTYVSFGLLFDHQEYLAGVDPAYVVDDTRWMVRVATTRLIGPAARIEGTAKVQPSTSDGSNYLAALVASVRLTLTRQLGLTTRFEYRRDSHPAPGVLPDDHSLAVSLSLAW